MSTRRTVVISDIHLGPVGPLTLFRDHVALCGLLEQLTAENGPLELILAGDTFDFLACPGYEGFDAERATEHLRLMLSSNKEVVSALGRLAARHKLTILAGNHDPELLLPRVRDLLAAEIGTTIGTDELLVPSPGERPAVHGRWLAERRVAVVHGDRWDPHNAIDRERLLQHGSIELPLGSQMVLEVLAQLQPTRRWIYELKPEIPTVLPLLIYLEPQRTWQLLQQKAGLTLQMLGGMLLARLRAGSLFGPLNGQPAASTDVATQLADMIAAGLLQEREADRQMLQAALLSQLRDGNGVAGTLAEHNGVARLVLRTWLRLVREAERFGELDSPDSMPESAASFLSVDWLVAGHTHGARYHTRTTSLPGYVNTGTWVPIGHLPQGSMREVLDGLDAGLSWPAEAPRTFAVIDEGPLEVWLGECDRNGMQRRISP